MPLNDCRWWWNVLKVTNCAKLLRRVLDCLKTKRCWSCFWLFSVTNSSKSVIDETHIDYFTCCCNYLATQIDEILSYDGTVMYCPILKRGFFFLVFFSLFSHRSGCAKDQMYNLRITINLFCFFAMSLNRKTWFLL
jgi:hypothetical protein